MKKHEAYFTYRNKKIPFYFWSKETTNKLPDTVIFLGTGQVGKVPRWVAETAPDGVVVVEGLPHWHSEPSANDLVDFAFSYIKCTYDAVLKEFSSPRMHLIGESQATPSLIDLANHIPDKINNIALLLPMGLNTNSFGDTNTARFKELRKRSLQTILQPKPLELRNLYAGIQLLKIVLSGMSDGSTKKKYTRGISQDMVEEFRTLVKTQKNKGHTVTLFIGAKDRLFPPHEIEQSLKKALITDVQIRVVPRKSHTSLVTRNAINFINQAVKTVREE